MRRRRSKAEKIRKKTYLIWWRSKSRNVVNKLNRKWSGQCAGVFFLKMIQIKTTLLPSTRNWYILHLHNVVWCISALWGRPFASGANSKVYLHSFLSFFTFHTLHCLYCESLTTRFLVDHAVIVSTHLYLANFVFFPLCVCSQWV